MCPAFEYKPNNAEWHLNDQPVRGRRVRSEQGNSITSMTADCVAFSSPPAQWRCYKPYETEPQLHLHLKINKNYVTPRAVKQGRSLRC